MYHLPFLDLIFLRVVSLMSQTQVCYSCSSGPVPFTDKTYRVGLCILVIPCLIISRYHHVTSRCSKLKNISIYGTTVP